MTTLVSAVDSGNMLMLKLLVAVPGMISEKELSHTLLKSASVGQAEAVQILLDAGADSDFCNSKGMTALLLAAESGHCEVVDTLLQAKCCINEKSLSGSTALHLACRFGHEDVTMRLLNAGIQCNVKDNSQKSALIMAAMFRKTQCLKTLLQHKCELNLQDNEGLTALHHACQKAVGVDLLLSAGANPNICDNFGNTPLMVAATEGFDNVVRSLVEHGCDMDFANNTGRAPIHYLAMKNHWRAIEYIAHAHGNINAVDTHHRLPLWYAVNHNRHHATKTLLRVNCGVDPDHAMENGENIPLKTALKKGLYGIAKLLILAGCKLQSLYEWLDSYEEDRQRRERERADRIRLFLDSDEESDSDTEDMGETEAYEWFQDWIHCPHTLRQLCRISVRRYIGCGFLRKVEDLPLPGMIRDYVTLKEVEDHPLHGELM